MICKCSDFQCSSLKYKIKQNNLFVWLHYKLNVMVLLLLSEICGAMYKVGKPYTYMLL